MRVNQDIRDLLMRQPETLMLNPWSCRYAGKIYRFAAVTPKTGLRFMNHLKKLIGING